MKRSLLLAIFCSVNLFAQSPQDPRLGTWKLNPDKSQFAQAAPKLSVRRYELGPTGFVVDTTIGLDAQGNPVFAQITFKLDGKEYSQYTQSSLAAFSAASAKPSTNAYKLLDANTVEVTTRDNTGQITSTSAQTVSPDRKTLTVTNKDSTGKTTNSTVWEKQ